MKIERKKRSDPVAPMGGAMPREARPDVQDAAPPPETDSVALSSAQRMRELHETVRAIPDIRVGRVDEVRSKVEDGSYHVPSGKLAKKVVDEVLGDELIRRRRARR